MKAGGLTMCENCEEVRGPSPHLKELDRIVNSGLPEVPDGEGRSTGFVNWPLASGTAMSWDMRTHLQKGECAVAETMLTKGTVFPYHAHTQAQAKETLICLKGVCLVRIHSRDDVVLHPGDSISLEPDTVHSVEAPETDSWLVAVTVPRDPGFPG